MVKGPDKSKKGKVKKQEKAVKSQTTSKAENDYLVSLTDLLEAGCHFGHQVRRSHPKMLPFIWKAKQGVHIFDLTKTQACLQTACRQIRSLVAEGKTVVFVGTKRQSQEIIQEEAQKAGAPYVTARWLGGTLTNWTQIKKRLDWFKEMKTKKATGEFGKYTKKEQLLKEREIERLEHFFGGIQNLDEPPDALFLVDSRKEKGAVREAKAKEKIVFAIVDSNTDPTPVDWPIPANDDAVRSIKLIVSQVACAVKEGMSLREKTKREKNDKNFHGGN